MKRIIITLMLVVSMCSVAFAGGTETVMVPSDCKTIQSATYSSGGGKKIIVYAKVHCVMKDGTDALFLASKASASGMFGFGRFTLPDRINIIRSDSLKNKAVWR